MQGQFALSIIFSFAIAVHPKAMVCHLILLTVVTTTLAMSVKQLQLEDIENEHMNNEHNSKTQMKQPMMQYGFRPMKAQQQYIQQPQQYIQQPQHAPPQNYYILPQQYVVPSYQTNPQPQTQYPDEQIVYVTNNHLPQQFYTPQYVFVNPEASSAMHPKFSLFYPQPNVQATQQASPTYQIEYVLVPQSPQQPPSNRIESNQNHKFSPKSLLDSYVPSHVQIQYLKQQQARENAVPHDVPAKSKQVKSMVYRNVPSCMSYYGACQ